VPSIAIVGAGPGMGLAIARTFGSRGFDVALIARNRDKLGELVLRLGAEGITADAFPADVLDHNALTQALKSAATRFGGVDVLEYSPAVSLESVSLPAPSRTGSPDVQWAIATTTGTPSPWGSRPVCDPTFVLVLRPDVRLRTLADVVNHLGRAGKAGIIDGTEIRVRHRASAVRTGASSSPANKRLSRSSVGSYESPRQRQPRHFTRQCPRRAQGSWP